MAAGLRYGGLGWGVEPAGVMCSDRLDQGRGIGYIDDMSKPPFPPVAPGQTPPPKKTAPAENDRDARLKAALRANLQRRKAQARQRDAADDEQT